MIRAKHILLCLVVTGMSACEKQQTPNAAPAPTVTATPTPTPPATPTPTPVDQLQPSPKMAIVPSDAREAQPHASDEGEQTEMNEEESIVYHRTCHFVLSRMASCAKDPGFKKYQHRWVEKGAPRANAKNFEKDILSWGGEADRTRSCKHWARSPNTRAHFTSRSRLNALREDAKLSCELFGQELDDDGWFPAVLIGN